MGAKYNNFLKSEWWKDIRQKTVKRGRGRCKACGSDQIVHVHHYNYRYKYAGKASKAVKDTILLCPSCHKAFHDQFGSKADMTEETEKFLKQVHRGMKKAKKLWEEIYEKENWLKTI